MTLSQTDSFSILSQSEHDVEPRGCTPREQIETLVARARFLPPDDRLLVQAIYVHGTAICDFAALTDRCPRSVSRRLQSILHRIRSPEYVYVTAHASEYLRDPREDRPAAPATESPRRARSASELVRRIARDCIIEGKPLRQLARELGVSYFSLRQRRIALRALADAGMTSPTAPRAGQRGRGAA
ncbi:MAG: hypothetical protein JNK35_00875 [Phycisphaerae bacterium]|nr:hypothetical protein [Phycisphaerae bacterium]